MKWVKYTLFFLNQFVILINAQDFSVETWRDHLPYSEFNQVVELGNFYYAATPYSIVEFDNSDNEITKLSTVNGLSEIGISCIAANNSYNSLLIAYNSSNLDLIKNGEITNISSILNSSIIGDKTIYSLYSYSKYIYACTGFGIVVIDIEKKEIKDTYILGNNNSQIKVKDLHISNDTIYALTENEIKYASLNNAFLSNPSVWDSHLLPQGIDINNLESFSEDFFVFGDLNIVFKYSNNQWDTIIYQPNELLRNFRVSDQKLITCTESYATIYDQNLDTLDLLYAYNGISGISPNDIIYGHGYYLIADDSKGFMRLKNNFSSERIGQGGPFTNECFHLSSNGENIYVAAGTPDGTNWNKTFNWHGIFQFNNNWSFYNQTNIPLMLQEIDTISSTL